MNGKNNKEAHGRQVKYKQQNNGEWDESVSNLGESENIQSSVNMVGRLLHFIYVKYHPIVDAVGLSISHRQCETFQFFPSIWLCAFDVPV